MNIVGIVTTMFDSLLMLLIAYIVLTSKDRERTGTGVLLFVIMIMNVFCIWGV